MGRKLLLGVVDYIANGLGGKNGTLVVDMSNMKGLSVDSASNIAMSETGNRLEMLQ
ncbi:hypothetical protein PM082_000023 [Marasmius tenuissimus]|nr:hypothetical protein PM082_000023 [Marasmius tenuissimus]